RGSSSHPMTIPFTGGAPVVPPKTQPQQPVPEYSQMSADEYNAALRQSIIADSTAQAPDASLTIPMPSPASTTPVEGFWHRLLFGVEGTSRLAEIGRSIPRGLAAAGNNRS